MFLFNFVKELYSAFVFVDKNAASWSYSNRFHSVTCYDHTQHKLIRN